jgi:hypothetical protein
MALRIHSLEQMASHAPRMPVPITKASSATSAAAAATSPTTQSTEAPSFTAVFAQIAAAAAAAGTTVASTAAPAGGTAAAASTAPEDASDGPAGPLFGANPWLTDPTGQGPDGSVTHYNPIYFATPQTAQTVAQMLGGAVTQSVQITTAPGSPFQQDEPNYMVQLPGGGMVNPGLIADLYTHGWNQTFINQQIAAEVAGAQSTVDS